MKRLATIALTALLLTGCSTQAPTPAPTDAKAQAFEKCVKASVDSYRIQYGEAHYYSNETKVRKMIEDRCKK